MAGVGIGSRMVMIAAVTLALICGGETASSFGPGSNVLAARLPIQRPRSSRTAHGTRPLDSLSQGGPSPWGYTSSGVATMRAPIALRGGSAVRCSPLLPPPSPPWPYKAAHGA